MLKGELLQPGVQVDRVGSFTPEMREADNDVARYRMQRLKAEAG